MSYDGKPPDNLDRGQILPRIADDEQENALTAIAMGLSTLFEGALSVDVLVGKWRVTATRGTMTGYNIHLRV